MENAAHVESLDREVNRTPLTVQPEFEYRKTPDNYRYSFFGPGPLPDQIKVWRIQASQKGNVVARGYGFEDSPDAEIIAVGFNHGKAYGDVGIGRQGNFLQWGYCDSPSQMTEAGRRLFINCIHYIRRFDGKMPLVRPRISGRSNALLTASYLKIITEKKRFFTSTFPDELWDKYQSDFDGLLAYYKENLELVYWERAYRVDSELKSLGLDSNRKIESLQRLIDLLGDAQRAGTVKKLLSRYTDQSFGTPPQWRQWFDESKGRLYFTDVGGYKFKVAPVGYLAAKWSAYKDWLPTTSVMLRLTLGRMGQVPPQLRRVCGFPLGREERPQEPECEGARYEQHEECVHFALVEHDSDHAEDQGHRRAEQNKGFYKDPQRTASPRAQKEQQRHGRAHNRKDFRGRLSVIHQESLSAKQAPHVSRSRTTDLP